MGGFVTLPNDRPRGLEVSDSSSSVLSRESEDGNISPATTTNTSLPTSTATCSTGANLIPNGTNTVLADTDSPTALALPEGKEPKDPGLSAGTVRLTARQVRERFPDEAVLAFDFPVWKKWWMLLVTFVVQVSMNYNAAVYAFAVEGMAAEFGVPESRARIGQWIFLLAYAFGCELWAPFSEEFGRKPIMQASLWLVNLFALVAALAPSDTGIIVARFLGGLCSAGGSVTLGIVADMYGPSTHHFALGFIVLSSCGGNIVGPLVGGALQQFLHWRWIFWTQLILGISTALLHLASPETDSNVRASRFAKKLQRQGEHVCGPHDHLEGRFHWKKLLAIMLRPFRMLATEPIVLALSLLSGFSDALIFTCLEAYGMVFKQWGFNHLQVGLAFAPLLIGYVIAYGLHSIDFVLQRRQMARLASQGLKPSPERRLKSLLFLGPLLPLGLVAFGALSFGPEVGMPWIAPLLASALVGVANYAIYMTTIDYMVAAYGRRYAASATGGNGFCRDFLAGIAIFYSAPLYRNLGPDFPLQKASWLLGGLALGLVGPVFVLYFKGAWVRGKSKMAEGLAATAENDDDDLVDEYHDIESSSAAAGRRERAPHGASRRSSSWTDPEKGSWRKKVRNFSRISADSFGKRS